MKFIILLFVATSIFSGSYGQYNESIRSARPGQAFGPFTTGKNIFQVQTGITLDSFNQSTSDLSGNGFGYLMSLRYGLEEAFEIRAAIAARSDKSTFNNTESTIGGISALVTGVRFNIRNGRGEKASYAIQTDVRLNVVDEDYSPNDLAPRIILLHGQKISDKLGLTTNWGVSWNGVNSTPLGFYVVNLSFPVSEKIGAFIETYGNITSDDFAILFDTGLSYLVNNDLQLDISAGYGSNNDITNTFIDAGISWRTGKWRGE